MGRGLRTTPFLLKRASRSAETNRDVSSTSLRHPLRKALLATTVYVALLVPVGALAQDPTPASENAPAPVETVGEAPTSEAAAETPTATETATSAPASTSPPEQTATPGAEPTAVATPTAQPSPTATPAGADDPQDELTVDFTEQVKGGKDGSQDSESRTIEGCLKVKTRRSDRELPKHSTSTTARECRVKTPPKPKVGKKDRPVPPVAPNGVPTISNPSLSLADPGAAPIGVPNFFIDKFRIPPFLLPIYQAAGTEYGIRWEILAAINEIETDYGRNLNISSAGALGWMQFMPATWKMYGVDANKDGAKDPFNPVDAIFAAARYLKAAGADTDLRRGIFAYNHADWYVDSVLLRARTIGGLPSNFVGSLTGLTQARFPVDARARYAGAVDTRKRRVARGTNVAMPVESDAARRDIDIFAKAGAPAIAVNDGRVVGLGRNAVLGRFVRLQDVYGNTYTYAHLGKRATTYPAPREKQVSRTRIARELKLPKADPKPTAAASSTRKRAKRAKRAGRKQRKAPRTPRPQAPKPAPTPAATISKDRLFAHPARPRAAASGGDLQLAQNQYRPGTGAALELNPRDFVAKRMRKGARVIAGTVLGRIGRTSKDVAPHLRFEIRPAGRGAPRIDPKPILDGWKLLESTEIYRAEGKNPFVGPDAKQPSIGQILLMSTEALQRHVLANPRIDVYACGRSDIRLGLVDRRVLSALEFLAASGLKPTVTSLRCGHGYLTASGNVSEHSSGNAVDIAAVNGVPIIGNQGSGSITEMTIQRLLTLQGTMKPHQIISLMTFKGADNTMAMSDHADHIHLGFSPLYDGDSRAAKQANAILKPDQWIKLIDRLGEIDNPVVATAPSKFALRVAPD